MIRGLFEKAGNFFGSIEDSVRDVIYNSIPSKKARTKKAVDNLTFYVRSLANIESDNEILLKRVQKFVPSGHYFVVGELYSAKNPVNKLTELVEYTWRERATINRTLPIGAQEILDPTNQQIIGEKQHAIIPEKQYYNIIQTYFPDEIDIIMMPKLRR